MPAATITLSASATFTVQTLIDFFDWVIFDGARSDPKASSFTVSGTFNGQPTTVQVTGSFEYGMIGGAPALTGGTITGVAITTNGVDQGTIATSANVDDLIPIIEAEENGSNPAALENFLLGFDWTFNGGSAADIAPEGLRVGDNVIFNLRGNDVANLAAGDDNVFCGAGNDTMNGGVGNDTLNGGAGNDSMDGGAGHDLFIVDALGDKVVEALNAGVDTVNTRLNTYTLGANVDRVVFTGTGNFTGAGNGLDNRLTGGGGDDRFVQSLGADIYQGGLGTDAVDYRTATTGAVLNFAASNIGGSAAGDIFGSIEKFLGSATAGDAMTAFAAGRANFSGYGGNDTLTGGSNIDVLQGGDGNDVLDGNAGKDTLQGDAGNDTITGGADRDQFVFFGAIGQDRITDYQDGLDLMKVHSTVADGLADFTIAGNGTNSVTLTLIAAPANTIVIESATAITLSAADFLFY